MPTHELSTKQVRQVAQKIRRDLNIPTIKDGITEEPIEGKFIGDGIELFGVTQDASFIYKKIKHSTVALQIQIITINEDDEEEVEWFGGTGFFISPDGYIVTAAHNVLTLNDFNDYDENTKTWKRVNTIYASVTNVNGIQGNHRIFECEIIGLDGASDIAIVKPLGVTLTDQHHLDWGQSRETDIGEACFVVGMSEFVDFESISSGIIRNNKHINESNTGSVEAVLVDASGTVGTSGGPILDKNGDVIGIFTFIEGSPPTGNVGGGISQYLAQDIVTVIINYDKAGRPQRLGYEKTDEPPFPDSDHPRVYNNGEFIKGYIGAFVVPVTPLDMITFLNGAYLQLRGLYVFLPDDNIDQNNLLINEDDILISIDDHILGSQDDQEPASALTWKKRPGDEVTIVVRQKVDNYLTEVTKTGTLLSWGIFDIPLTPYARATRSRLFFPIRPRIRQTAAPVQLRSIVTNFIKSQPDPTPVRKITTRTTRTLDPARSRIRRLIDRFR